MARNEDSVRRQGPRRRDSSKPIPQEADRMRESAEVRLGAVADADTGRGDSATAGTTHVDRVRGEPGISESQSKKEDSKESSSKLVLGMMIGVPIAIIAIAGLAIGISKNASDSEPARGSAVSPTSEAPTIKPIDYDAAETSAWLYCSDAPIRKYEDNYDAVRDECVDFVLSEIRNDEERFREEAKIGDSGYIPKDRIKSVLGDPEAFLKDHGYTTTTSTTTTKTSTSLPKPTYQEPEPTYEPPANNSGSSGSSGSSSGSAGVGGGGRSLAWRTVGPFGGLQGCENTASQEPLYASECYVGSDNLYYYDSKVQSF